MKINVWNEQIQLENPELVIGRIAKPVILEIWNGRQKDSVIRREYPYTRITQTEDGLKACTEIDDEWAGKTEVTDIYRTEEGSVVLSRQGPHSQGKRISRNAPSNGDITASGKEKCL